MKKLILGTAALLAVASSALAADLPPRTYTKAPIAAQIYDWTGFYVGANIGVGVARDPSGLLVTSIVQQNPQSYLSPIGAIGGAQAGYNWQSGNLVLGLEADIQASGMRDSSTCTFGCTIAAGVFTPTQSLDWFGTARVRAGLATGPVFTYVTGGFAFGEVKTTSAGVFAGTGPLAATRSDVKTGWTLGSGVEASLGGNWTGKIEYLYVDLGNQFLPGTAAPFPANTSVDTREHIFRAGVNYRIGGTRAYAEGPASNWSGLYAGLNAGSGLARNAYTFGIIAPAPTTADQLTLMPKGFLGGGQAGYNWQAANWVYGLEADIQGTNVRDGDNCMVTCSILLGASTKQSLPWFGTVRGRLGYSLGSTLYYGTAGLAYGEVKNDTTAFAVGVPSFRSVSSHTQAGWTAGGGIESPLELFGLFGKNWSVKSEYLYVDLGSYSGDNFAFAGRTFASSGKVQEHIVRSGINYHFNSPVVARY